MSIHCSQLNAKLISCVNTKFSFRPHGYISYMIVQSFLICTVVGKNLVQHVMVSCKL